MSLAGIDPVEGGAREWWNSTWLLGALVLLALCLWVRRSRAAVVTVKNSTPQSRAPSGMPLTLAAALARTVDAEIPVTLASAAAVPYDNEEVQQVLQLVLDRVNSFGQRLSFIAGQWKVHKTLDAYKTVGYEATFNAHDAATTVGVRLRASVLVPADNKVYVRSLVLSDAAEAPGGGGVAAAVLGSGPEYARFQSPAEVLRAFVS